VPPAANGVNHYTGAHGQYGGGGAVAAVAAAVQEANNNSSSSSSIHGKNRLSFGGKPLSPIPEGTVPAVLGGSSSGSNVGGHGGADAEEVQGSYKDVTASSDPIVSPARLTMASRVKAARLLGGGVEGLDSRFTSGSGTSDHGTLLGQDSDRVGGSAGGSGKGGGSSDLQNGALARLSDLALVGSGGRNVREGGGSREVTSSSSSM
jgi:hypothetical protein